MGIKLTVSTIDNYKTYQYVTGCLCVCARERARVCVITECNQLIIVTIAKCDIYVCVTYWTDSVKMNVYKPLKVKQVIALANPRQENKYNIYGYRCSLLKCFYIESAHDILLYNREKKRFSCILYTYYHNSFICSLLTI